MRNETKTLNLSFNELSAWQNFLHGKGYGTYDVAKKWTVKFEDGVEADIKVCDGGPDGTPYIDAVLFLDGHEIGRLDVDDTLAGEYVFHKCRDIDYIVIIPDTIESAKEGQKKFRAVEKWLQKQSNSDLDTINATTLAEVMSGNACIDRTAIIDDILERADNYEEILDSLYQRATIKFFATGKQAFPDASVEKK